MIVKPRLRLEMDWSWLRACFDWTPRERRAFSVVLAIVLLGIAARSWYRGRDNRTHPPEPIAEEVAP